MIMCFSIHTGQADPTKNAHKVPKLAKIEKIANKLDWSQIHATTSSQYAWFLDQISSQSSAFFMSN